jgi:hypothetical protein
MINQREFDKVYTVGFILKAQGTVAVNKKNYFTGYPFLRNIKPKAISINNTSIANDAYLSISNNKGNYCLFNFPMSDLYLTDDYPKAKIRLFNIEGVDLLNSYWIYAGTSPFSVVTETNLFNLSFYY